MVIVSGRKQTKWLVLNNRQKTAKKGKMTKKRTDFWEKPQMRTGQVSKKGVQ
jgi:hypothetical protein